MSTHYNPRVSQVLALLPIIAALLCLPARATNHRSAPPPKPAAAYPANDTHPGERLTIAADPCDDPRLCSFFRLPYIQHGLLPIRVILTNDGDRALQLDEARFQFITAAGDTLPAATEDEINRRLFTLHSTQPIRIPLDPFPVHRTPIDKKITQDDDDFGFQGTIVNAHSTLAGYLFYDIKGLDDPALKGAQALRQDDPHPRRRARTLRLHHPLRQVARRQPQRPLQPPPKVKQLQVVSYRLLVDGCWLKTYTLQRHSGEVPCPNRFANWKSGI